MASGTINFAQSASSGSYIDAKIEWSATADKDNNSSDVTAKLYVRKDNTDMTLTIETVGTWSYSLTVNGSKVTSTVSKSVLTDWVLIATKTVNDIIHNSDGSKSITISGSISAPSGTTLAGHTTSGSDTVDFDTIPRASTITSAENRTLGKACSVKWTPASKSFRYKLKFSLGDWSYTTGAIHPNTTSAYTYTGYTLPLAVANQLPNDTTGTMTVKLYTYSNSGATTQVGSASSKTFTVTVPNNSSTKPDVTMTLSAVSSLGSAFSGLYVQGKSKVKASISAEGKYEASISSYKMYVGSTSYGSPYQSGYLSTSGSVTVKGRAYDSRGYYNDISKSITVIPYSKPKIQPASGESSIICARCDADGNLDDSGTYLKIKAKRSYSKVTADSEQKNFCIIRYRYRKESATSFGSWATILAKTATSDTVNAVLSGVVSSATTAYVVQVGVVDDIGETATVQFNIPTDFVTVDIPEKHYGRRIGIGRYAEDSDEDGIDIALPIHGGMVDNLTLGELLTATSSAPIDLNNIKTAGNYYSPSGDNSQYITNTPYKGGGFGLIVREIQSTKMIRQEMFFGRTNWQRHYSSETESWSDWLRYLMTTQEESTTTDFVIESGEREGWTYKKWKSGTYEMFGYFDVTPTECTQQEGRIVYRTNSIAIKAPFKIASACASGTVQGYCWLSNSGISTDHESLAIRLLSTEEISTTASYNVRLAAMGKYDT